MKAMGFIAIITGLALLYAAFTGADLGQLVEGLKGGE